MAKVTPTIPLVGSSRWFSVNGFTLCLLLFASLWYVTVGQSWHCGSATETVKTVCNGCYAGGSHQSRIFPKRSHPERIPFFKEPFLKKSYALNFLHPKSHASDEHPAMLRQRRSGRRGFIDECCRQNCDFYEMIFYCCAAQQRLYAEYFKLVRRSS